jgi:hypothetical protein
MNLSKEELLQIIEVLNNQVASLNLENIILKTQLDTLNRQQENQED